MTSRKRFFLVFFAVYLAVGSGIIGVFGPPGVSGDYLGAFKSEHDRYLAIIKNEEYKRYVQRPELAPAAEALQADAAFVAAYEKRPEFVREHRRRAAFEYLFEALNIGAVVCLLVRFGRSPLLKFLDRRIARIRGDLERVNRRRREAAERQGRAQAQLDGIENDKVRIEQEVDEYMAVERRRIEQATADGYAQLDREAQDRMRHEALTAAMRLRRDLIEQAIEAVAEAYKTHGTPEQEGALVDRFLRGARRPS
ncbi:MAG TPA: hypothetical protein HPP83_08515 [Candidatus Hydrogenedentes bacterium]|nr:hypothetical protein [Candidatus Hydrogenedentota bacterium]